ncbi:MAG TPA: IS1380 family transposase [Candidatus Dormibacteraeota bacterium]|nr:IS1380 family transposase [Candidatus Dormibacteraeota bacterium]
MKQTECTQIEFEFQGLGRRRVVGQFDGGRVTSDGGVVLLREFEGQRRIVQRFAECFVDYRDPRYLEHTVAELVGQRVFGLALGYEDLIDHDELRWDVMLAVAVGKCDPTGAERRHQRDQGKALAGKSTLNRLELRTGDKQRDQRYKKIEVQGEAVDRLLVDILLESYQAAPERIVLDLDGTDDPVHGNQEGRFFHGYYREYCYLPLYIFCGAHLLCARLRTADQGERAGAIKELERIVPQLRARWPQVPIVIRGDSSFGAEDLMKWCEENQVDYVLGKAKNQRLVRAIGAELEQARQACERTGKAARVFKDFSYRTKKSWSRARRVIGKAEYLGKGANPRFVVTSLSAAEFDARRVYEEQYCGRGDMENRIKEQQLCLFADRTSTSLMKANQLRLWFSSIAYVLMNEFRIQALKGTEMAKAQCSTMRLKLLKIGAVVRVSVRRVVISLAECYPYQQLFRQVYQNLLRQQFWPPALRG